MPGMFGAQKRQKAEEANEPAPDDLTELFWCPTCGHTPLAGTLEVHGRWLRCSECHFTLTDSESVRIWLTTKETSE